MHAHTSYIHAHTSYTHVHARIFLCVFLESPGGLYSLPATTAAPPPRADLIGHQPRGGAPHSAPLHLGTKRNYYSYFTHEKAEVQGCERVTLVGTATGLCAESCGPPSSTAWALVFSGPGLEKEDRPRPSCTCLACWGAAAVSPGWDRGCFQLPCPASLAQTAPDRSVSSQSS